MVDAAEMVISSSYKNLLMLTILENHEAKTIEMVTYSLGRYLYSNNTPSFRYVCVVIELRFRIVEKTLDRSDVAANQFQPRGDAVQRMGLSPSVFRARVYSRTAGRTVVAKRRHCESLDENERR